MTDTPQHVLIDGRSDVTSLEEEIDVYEKRREEKRREEKRWQAHRWPGALTIAGGALALFLASSPQATGRALIPLCESGFAGGDAYAVGAHLSGNDIYMRYGAAEYLGSSTDSFYDNYFVLGWVGEPDPATGHRTLWVGMVRDYPPQQGCVATGSRPSPSVPGPGVPYPVDLASVVDVNWVQHGGHVPAGQVGRATYPSQGYLVWSSRGDENTAPAVVVGRFRQENGVLRLDPIRLSNTCTPSACRAVFPQGITPSMASNRPMPFNQDYTSATRRGPYYYDPALICRLARIFGPFGGDLWSRCDYGHRLALVYSGAPRWITERKTNIEDVGCNWSDPSQDCRFWIGSTIEYKIFRPGDNQVLYEGTLADIRDNPDYDPVLDHAIYPEIVWNEASQQWLVVWEEASLDTISDPPHHSSRWKARTLDAHGNLGDVTDLGECRSWSTPTSIDPGGGPDVPPPGDDEPPVARIQRNYCYPLNMANDYYSLDAAPWGGDRNRHHLSVLTNYMIGWDSVPAGPFQWLVDATDPPSFARNLYGALQHYTGHPPLESISVIGHPTFRDQTPYDQASYAKVSYEYDPGYGCRNVFYLLVDNPDGVHQEGPDPNQQYYRVEDSGLWDPDCEKRFGWATASSMTGLVALWSQWVPSLQRYEMRFGTYFWSYPGQ